jgi:hypothetical protein
MRRPAKATIGEFVVVDVLHRSRVLDNASVVVNMHEESGIAVLLEKPNA